MKPSDFLKKRDLHICFINDNGVLTKASIVSNWDSKNLDSHFISREEILKMINMEIFELGTIGVKLIDKNPEDKVLIEGYVRATKIMLFRLKEIKLKIEGKL